MSANDTFCTLPWIHQMWDEEGYHRLCCTAEGDGALLRDSAGRPMHVSDHLPDHQVLNSPTLKEIRGKMMRGAWPAACFRCKLSESAGAPSIRTMANERFQAQFPRQELLSRTGADGQLEEPVIRFADIRLGNVCNLTCRMCGPRAARLWTTHFNDVQPQAKYRLKEDELKIFGQPSWPKTQPLESIIEQLARTLHAIQFAGGEPLIIPEMAAALRILIRSGRAGEIELSYNTNLTTMPEAVTSLWPHFKRVQLLCSVDGFGGLNDYIRRPSQWKTIDANLHLVDKNYKEWKLENAAVCCTVQIYNALALPDLYKYMRTAGFVNLTPLPLLHPLFTPDYLSIQVLPKQVKRLVKKQLLIELERAERDHPHHLAHLGGIRTIIEFLEAEDHSQLLADFKSFSEKSDKAFTDSWRVASPALAAQLEPKGLRGLLRRLGLA